MYILRCLNLVDKSTCITANAACSNFNSLDYTVRINDKCTAIRNTLFFNQNIEVTGDGVRRIADHNVSNFANRFGAIMPCFVYKMGVCRYGVHFNTKVLQSSILILQILKLCRANECEVCRIEANYTPFSFKIRFRYIDKFTIVISCCFKREYFFSNQ
ncbi:hypothetical protein D3C76_1008660 [compost metagenome]